MEQACKEQATFLGPTDTKCLFENNKKKFTRNCSAYLCYLSEHVEEEPVSHLALLDDGVDDFPLDQPEADVEEVSPHPRAQDDHRAVQHHQGRQAAEDQKPVKRKVNS